MQTPWVAAAGQPTDSQEQEQVGATWTLKAQHARQGGLWGTQKPEQQGKVEAGQSEQRELSAVLFEGQQDDRNDFQQQFDQFDQHMLLGEQLQEGQQQQKQQYEGAAVDCIGIGHPRRDGQPYGVPLEILRELRESSRRRKAVGVMLDSVERVWDVARRAT